MDTVEMGWRPLRIAPVFSAGQDWIVTLEPKDNSPSPYPEGTIVTAKLYQDDKLATILAPPLKEWPGEIVGNQVRFHVEAADVDTVKAKTYMRVMIDFPGTPQRDPFCWAKGKVVRDD